MGILSCDILDYGWRMKKLGLLSLLIMTLGLTACVETGFTSVDRTISRFFGYESARECVSKELGLDRDGDWREYCRKICPLLKSQVDWSSFQFDMQKVKTLIQQYEMLEGDTRKVGLKKHDLLLEIKNELGKHGKAFWPGTYCTSTWKRIGDLIRGTDPPETLPSRI